MADSSWLFVTFATMRKLEDTYQHKGLRKKLIDSLRTKGITSEVVLEAMYNIPRHFFLDSAFDKIAYEDRAFPIAADQTISQPYTVAYQTQLLNVHRGYKYFIERAKSGQSFKAISIKKFYVGVFCFEKKVLIIIEQFTLPFYGVNPCAQFRQNTCLVSTAGPYLQYLFTAMYIQ